MNILEIQIFSVLKRQISATLSASVSEDLSFRDRQLKVYKRPKCLVFTDVLDLVGSTEESVE